MVPRRALAPGDLGGRSAPRGQGQAAVGDGGGTWVSRADGRPPEVLKGRVYVDAITFHASAARLTAEVFGREAMVLGSDYPFDMRDPDPVTSARKADLDLEEMSANALRWIGDARSTVAESLQRAARIGGGESSDLGSE